MPPDIPPKGCIPSALSDCSGTTTPRPNATFGLEKPSSPKIALERQANHNAVSYMPLPAVQSAML